MSHRCTALIYTTFLALLPLLSYSVTPTPLEEGQPPIEIGAFHYLVITNAESNEPIEGVSITLDGVYLGETGPLGRFRLADAIEGRLFGFHHTSFAAAYYTPDELRAMDYAVKLTESVLNIQEVVIRANRTTQNYSRTPQSVRTIDAKQLETAFQPNAADAIGMDPNVFIQKSQSGGGSPMIRGMSTSRVLLMVDGIRMNNAIFRAGNVHNVISVDGESIANVEISLGPGSVLHGSDALGGVMHLNTYEAHYGDSSEVLQSLVFTLSHQSATLERRPNFRINYGGKNWAAMTSLTYTQYADIHMGRRVHSWTPESHLENTFVTLNPVSFGTMDSVNVNENPYIQPETGYHQRNLTQKFKVRVAPKSEIKTGMHLSQTGDINRYDRYIRTRNGMPRYARWSYGPQTWLMSYLSFENRSNTAWSDYINFTLSGQFFEESRDTRDFQDPTGRIQLENVYVGQANLDIHKLLPSGIDLTYGTEYLFNLVDSRAHHYSMLYPDSTWAAQNRYADGSTWQSASLYANAGYALSDSWSLNSGIRLSAVSMFTPISFNGFEEDAQLNFLAPSGQVGITYHKPTFKYFAMLGTGFRAPNVDDASKVFDSQPGALIVPNANLREERLYSAEMGATQKLGKSWALDASFYYSYLNNIMDRAPYTFQGSDSIFYDGELSQVLAIQNLDYAWIWGYQFGIRTDLSKNLHATAHWSHPFGRDHLGNPLRHVAPFNAQSGLYYRQGKWKANFIARYNGSIAAENLAWSELDKTYMYAINDNGDPYVPAWYTLNLSASYSFNKNIVVRAGVDNLMDIRYRPYSSGVAAPGRSLFLSMSGSI